MARTSTEIQTDITAVRAGILAVVSGAQSYTLDTGQGKQTVTRASIKDLRFYLRELEQELEDSTEPGILAGNFDRGANW